MYAPGRKFTLTCFLGMCDALLCCANFDDSVRFCMWCKMMFVCRACAVLCCHFCVTLPRLVLRNPRSVGSDGATTCWKANLGDRHFVKSSASRRLWVVPRLRAEHRRADRTLPTLSTKTWCSSKRGLGFWCFFKGSWVFRCKGVSGCSGV